MATTSGSGVQLASFSRRMIAHIIDWIITGLLALIVGIPFLYVGLVLTAGWDAGAALFGVGDVSGVAIDPTDGPAEAVFYILFVSLPLWVPLTYFIVTEGVYGYTVGKKLLGIHVVDEHGSRIGLGASAIRNIFRIVDMMPMGYLLGMVVIGIRPDQRRFGDMAASTLVIRG